MSLERYIARRQWIDDQPPGHSRRKAQVKMPQRAPFKIWALKTFYPHLYKKQLDAFLAKNYTNPSELPQPAADSDDVTAAVKTGRLKLGDVREFDGQSYVCTDSGIHDPNLLDPGTVDPDDYEEITYVNPNPTTEQLEAMDRQIEEDAK